MPSTSEDGSVLAYCQISPTRKELRLRNNASGRETVLATGPNRPKVSPDGSQVAYSTWPSGRGLFMVDAAGGQARELVRFDKGGQIYSWPLDSNFLVFYRTAPIRFFLFDLRAGQEQELLSHPKIDIQGAEPSRDWKWIAFHLPGVVNTAVTIAPLRNGRAAGDHEWITIAAYPGRNNRPWWSPDGNLLYFLSLKDSYPDIWAQRLHPQTKRPVGEAFPVYHFHETRKSPNNLSAANFGPAISRSGLTFSLREQVANIWLAEQIP